MADEQRRHLRLPVASRVFIELVAPGLAEDDHGEIATCRTLDVSRGGLRVSLDRELTVGAILQIGVEWPGADDTLYLAGEVKWCRELHTGQHRWSAGFQLMNANNSDIASWLHLLSAMDR